MSRCRDKNQITPHKTDSDKKNSITFNGKSKITKKRHKYTSYSPK